MGKLTISMAMFNSYVKLPEGNGNWMVSKRMEPISPTFEKVAWPWEKKNFGCTELSKTTPNSWQGHRVDWMVTNKI